jgi:hypothetical protein
MPEPIWRIDAMGGSMAEAGIKVNTTTKPAALGRMGYSPAALKPLICGPVAGKRQTGQPRWIIRSRKSDRIGVVDPSSPFGDGMRRGVFSEMALLKIIL